MDLTLWAYSVLCVIFYVNNVSTLFCTYIQNNRLEDITFPETAIDCFVAYWSAMFTVSFDILYSPLQSKKFQESLRSKSNLFDYVFSWTDGRSHDQHVCFLFFGLQQGFSFPVFLQPAVLFDLRPLAMHPCVCVLLQLLYGLAAVCRTGKRNCSRLDLYSVEDTRLIFSAAVAFR